METVLAVFDIDDGPPNLKLPGDLPAKKDPAPKCFLIDTQSHFVLFDTFRVVVDSPICYFVQDLLEILP